MIGLVIVSHSARLAEGVCELAAQVAQGRVRLAAAGGTGDPENPIGTDAFRVLEAIESVWDANGVLVFTDLGSAVLSAETAIEMLDADRRRRVRLCDAPLVEGAVAAATLAGAGAGLDEAAGEPGRQAAGDAPAAEVETTVTAPNRLGLHARPAAQLVRLARRFHAQVAIENLSRGASASASGIHGVLALGARQGDTLRIRASGSDAARAAAELAAFIGGGCGEKDEPAAEGPAPEAPSTGAGELHGIPGAAGVAIGPLVRFKPAPAEAAARAVEDPAAERQRLADALRAAAGETLALYAWAQAHAGAAEAALFDAQVLMLEDPALVDTAGRRILEERATAEDAWQSAAARSEALLGALDDPYLRARAADVADVGARVLRALAGQSAALPAFERPSILAAHDLTPSQVKELDPGTALGICLEAGGAGAHSTILARAMGIPVVAGLGPALAAVPEGTTVALDGARGLAWIAPGAERVRALETLREASRTARRTARAERLRPAVTRDGRAVRVLANINSVPGAAEALECGAEGIGVLRTEFLFLGRAEAPSEDEQYAAYRAIAGIMGERPLVIRTLDIGGDKALPYIGIGRENNPFLGRRGIRVSLAAPALLRAQLRAILRAGAGRRVDVLFPMISTPAEFRQALAALEEAAGELAHEGAAFARGVGAGVMIEVPAAVAMADRLACEAGFFSIGTNDLAQYVMAADRTNPQVAPLADALEPAVLRMVRQAVRAARAAGIPAALCGELAADTAATPLLLGLGLEEFSLSAPLIPDLKRAIARVRLRDAGALADEALALDSAAEVRALLARRGTLEG